MAILINLLPDVKQERLRVQKHRRFAVGLSVLVIALALAVPILLLVAKGTQAVLTARTQDSIDKKIQELQNTPDLADILTTQAHLKSLPALYSQRLLPTRFFDAIPATLPTSVRLSGVEMDLSGSAKFTGYGDNYAAVQKFVAALEAANSLANQSASEQQQQPPAKLFSRVQLDSVSSDLATGDVLFIISSSFDPGVLSAKAN